MFILFIFVLQIIYCSAYCNCPGDVVVLPIYGIVLIGIAIASLFFTAVGLAVCLFRLKQDNGNDRSIFGKPKLSISKYERQLSGNSNRMILKDSINDDTAQLNSNENINDDDSNSSISNQVKIETEPDRKPPKLTHKPKVPIFPHMPEEQINKICEAVLNKHRNKEFTSLSELDKIVNDAKEEKSKIFDTSASTPELDNLDEVAPIPVKKLPVFDANSKESKLRDEMKAMFNQNEFKSILKSKKKTETSNDTTDSKDETKQNDEIESGDENKHKNNIVTKYHIVPKDEGQIKKVTSSEDLKTKVEENIPSVECLDKTKANLNQAKINAEQLFPEIMEKFKQNSKSKSSKFESLSESLAIQDSNLDEDVSQKENVDLDEIYDSPPTRLQEEFYDFLPSPKECDSTYDYPPSPKSSNELYDFPPSPKPHSSVYDRVSPEKRNVLVSDGNATGYILPISTPSSELFEGPEYTNAKTLLNKDA